MEECVRRNEAEGKEINPVTCNFVKKCKADEVRNEQGRCTKKGTKTQNKPIVVPFSPYVYTNPSEQKKRVTYNRKKAKVIKRKTGNTFTYNVGYAGRRRKTAKLYANHPLNTRTTIGKETRNSLNLENAKRGKQLQLQTINEAPEALANLEQELGESDESNMRPLQVRKRVELKKKAEELAKKETPNNGRIKPPKKRRAKSKEQKANALGTSLNVPNTEL